MVSTSSTTRGDGSTGRGDGSTTRGDGYDRRGDGSTGRGDGSTTRATTRVFDPCGELPTGTTVLEASAGTGKTHTIATLAARYVAEGMARIDELMLVTFGRAATVELRERVRERFVTTAAALADPAAARTSDDRSWCCWPPGRTPRSTYAGAGWRQRSPSSTPPPSRPRTGSACRCWPGSVSPPTSTPT